MCYNKLRFFKSSRGCDRGFLKKAHCHTAHGGAICCQNEKCWVCCDHIILGVAASVHVHVNPNKAACRGRYSDFVSIASRLPGGDVVAESEIYQWHIVWNDTISGNLQQRDCSGFSPDSLLISAWRASHVSIVGAKLIIISKPAKKISYPSVL